MERQIPIGAAEVINGGEIVLGLVARVGVNLQYIQDLITENMNKYGYRTISIRVSKLMHDYLENLSDDGYANEYERIIAYMDAGDAIRRQTGRDDAMAIAAMVEIARNRDEDEPKSASIIRSLKHPDEIFTMRSVYQTGFFLLGVNSSKTTCIDQLRHGMNMDKEKAQELVDRDEGDEEHGQNTTKTFQMADAYVNADSPSVRHDICRIIAVLFGDYTITPTKDEWAMYLAFAASTRSAELSRQVGASLLDSNDNLIAVGANEVPCAGGGLYWNDHEELNRDMERGFDANEKEKEKIIWKIMEAVSKIDASIEEDNEQASQSRDETESQKEPTNLERAKEILSSTGILHITEYGRSVHAEMDALTTCIRTGASALGGKLYVTTFPCHNCAKHIVASGIKEVVYIEPYPKSKAFSLHSDSIAETPNGSKVWFRAFTGIGPRRYFDLFSLKHGSGYSIERKEKGRLKRWIATDATFRTPMARGSYIENEEKMVYILDESYRAISGDSGEVKEEE